VLGVLTTSALAESPRGEALVRAIAARGVVCTEVGEKEFLSAADTEHPQGVLAIAEVPAAALESVAFASNARVLVLDAIQDPGNVGTLVRTAAALGVAAVVALPGTADLWNAKAVRSGAGAHFHVPVAHATPDELLAILREAKIPLWGTAADGVPLLRSRSAMKARDSARRFAPPPTGW
jgi:TrmH family RNA methyltransferase